MGWGDATVRKYLHKQPGRADCGSQASTTGRILVDHPSLPDDEEQV